MKFAFGVLFMLSSALQAALPCANSLQGRVSDRESGEGLAFATIQVIGTDVGVITDVDGKFELLALCPGAHQLRVSHIGCKPQKTSVVIPFEGQLDLQLSHSDYHLHEVLIQADHRDIHAMVTLEAKEAELAERAGTSLAEMSELIAGIRVLQSGNTVAKPIFRGLHSNRLVVLNAGIRQEGQNWGTEHSPEIDSYIAHHISILEGPDALPYGSDGMAGMLLVEPQSVFASDSLTGKIQSEFSTNGRGGSIGLDLRSRLSAKIPLYFAVQGSAKKLGWVKTPDAYLQNTGIEEGNYAYSLGWKANTWNAQMYYSNFNQTIGLYRYSHLGNLSDLAEVINGRPQPDTLGFSYAIERPRQEISHEMVRANFNWKLSPESKLKLTYARQYNSRKEFDLHIGLNPSAEALSKPQLDYGLTSHIGTASWDLDQGEKFTSIGVQGLSRRNRSAGRTFIPPYRTNDLALFALQRRSLGAWNLAYGFRYEWLETEVPVGFLTEGIALNQRYSGLAASVSAGKPIAHGGFQLIAGTSWRPPGINELYASGLHHGSGVIEQGDDNLKLERLWQVSAALHQDFNRNHFVGSVYINYFDGFIYANPKDLELSIRGAFPRLDYEQSNAIYWGGDFQLESKPIEKVTTTLRASLVWAQNISNGSYFIQIPAHQFDVKARYNFNDFKNAKRLYIGGDLRYTMRQYRAPKVFDYNTLFDQAPAPLPASFDFASAPDAYFLVGLEAGFDLGSFTFSTRVDNLLNTNYRNYLDLFRYYADEPGINFSFRTRFNF